MPKPVLTISLPDNLTFDLMYVKGGDFMMGDEVGDLWEACRPVHPVLLSSYYMGKYPVTQDLWQSVMGSNPSSFKGEKRPVERVSWDDTQKFCGELNRLKWTAESGIAGSFRLPTEAEWEYAARGGCFSQRHLGAEADYLYGGSDRLNQVGWDEQNARENCEVGLLLPNELGLYDMSGNVWEWCEDWHSHEYYKQCDREGMAVDPKGPLEGDNRVVRGGSFVFHAQFCRVAFRDWYRPGLRGDGLGFRLVFAPQSNAFPDTREQKRPEAVK